MVREEPGACDPFERADIGLSGKRRCLVYLLETGLEDKNGSAGVEWAELETSQSPCLRYFGDYEILRELGRGGMGVVYEAQQFGTRRTVALKLLSAGAFASSDAVHRFHIEAQAAARLEHPHIVPVYEAGMHDGQHFLAMRFMPGGTLGKWAAACPLEARRAAKMIRCLAQATSYAHERGVLHRDIKPANILLDQSGEPYLADFGLARLLEIEGGITLTAAILGTAAYMPPEQAAGGAGAGTTAGDIYGLGAVLYELLAGQPPFTGASLPEVLRKVQEEEPVALPLRKSDLATICLKCLEKQPAKRYATARDLAGDLDRFLNDEPIFARHVSGIERFGRWCRRRQIARLNVLNGVNLMQEGDCFRSLLWFAEALASSADPPERAEVDRQRIASIVARCPKLVAVITHEGQPVGHAAFHPARQQLATVGRDRRLRIWDVPTGDLVLSTEPFAERPSAVWFSPAGERILLISSEFNHATLLAAAAGKTVAGLIPHFVGGANNRPLPSIPLENLDTGDLRSMAELLSGSRLDGTGGWKPLELGEIVALWNHLHSAQPSLFQTIIQTPE